MDQNTDQNTDKIEQLNQLRKRTVGVLRETLSQLNEIDPQQQFDLAMNILKYDSDPSLINAAVDAASKIADPQQKSDLLVQVLNEINYIEDSLKTA